MTTWYQKLPERLAYELEDFSDRGLTFVLDEDERRVSRRIVLRGFIEHDGQTVALEVIYPDTYPYVQPEVVAPDLEIDRHRNPFEGNLCLLGRATRAWDSDWTAAKLIERQVPRLLELVEAGGEEMRAGEIPQGEPLSFYYPGPPGVVIFVPEAASAIPTEVTAGRAVVRLGAFEPDSVALRGMLTEVSTKTAKRKTHQLVSVGEPLAERFGGRALEIRWVRLETLPASREAADFFAAAGQLAEGLGRPHWQSVGDGEVAVLGVVFSEEVRQGEYEDSWVFAVMARAPSSPQERHYLTAGQRLSREYLTERIPHLRHLGAAKVALAGVGGMGAPLALELARAQVGELRILDYDRVESGNIVRWPLGLTAVGLPKLEALGLFMQQNYPLTELWKFQVPVGQVSAARAANAPTEYQMLERFLDGVDVIIDATAELGISQLLADMAAEREVPLVLPWLTEGLAGGAVVTIHPPATGCWVCLQHHLDQGSIPLPPRDETGTAQPRGCSAATFTGASHEALPLIAQAAQVACQVLDGQLPEAAILERCDQEERLLPTPRWRTYPLTRHEACSCAYADV